MNTLQQRTKRVNKSKNLQIGDMVLIHLNFPSPPLLWPLARITAVDPGSDGIVGVVDINLLLATFLDLPIRCVSFTQCTLMLLTSSGHFV